MVAAYVSELRRLYSRDRLNRYAPSNQDDLMMVVTYLWNIELCKGLYPSLCTLEVSLRNSLHVTLSSHFNRDDWYDIPNVVQRDEKTAIDITKRSIRQTGKPVVPGRIIAGLNFGFWTNMLSGLYGNSPKGPQLWTSPHSPLLEY